MPGRQRIPGVDDSLVLPRTAKWTPGIEGGYKGGGQLFVVRTSQHPRQLEVGTTMRKQILMAACALIFSSNVMAADDPLVAGFVLPPASAHPQTWWHWMNGNITKEGITADLEAMHRVGIQEANIITVRFTGRMGGGG